MSRRRASASGRHGLGHLEGQRREIGPLLGSQGEGLELGHLEQLLHQPAHAGDILAQRRRDRAVAQRIEMGGQDGERRAQLMRRVGGEIALGAKALVEAVEGGVDRPHQRRQLARQVVRAAGGARSPPA